MQNILTQSPQTVTFAGGTFKTFFFGPPVTSSLSHLSSLPSLPPFHLAPFKVSEV